MRILIATDAWHPQVNGVVRTLTSLKRAAGSLGADIEFLTPEGFPSMELPTYPGLRVAWTNRREIARRIEAAAPEAIHIATEGPVGWVARAVAGAWMVVAGGLGFLVRSIGRGARDLEPHHRRDGLGLLIFGAAIVLAAGYYGIRTSARLGTIRMPAARSLPMSALIISAWPGGYWVTIRPELPRP